MTLSLTTTGPRNRSDVRYVEGLPDGTTLDVQTIDGATLTFLNGNTAPVLNLLSGNTTYEALKKNPKHASLATTEIINDEDDFVRLVQERVAYLELNPAAIKKLLGIDHSMYMRLMGLQGTGQRRFHANYASFNGQMLAAVLKIRFNFLEYKESPLRETRDILTQSVSRFLTLGLTTPEFMDYLKQGTDLDPAMTFDDFKIAVAQENIPDNLRKALTHKLHMRLWPRVPKIPLERSEFFALVLQWKEEWKMSDAEMANIFDVSDKVIDGIKDGTLSEKSDQLRELANTMAARVYDVNEKRTERLVSIPEGQRSVAPSLQFYDEALIATILSQISQRGLSFTTFIQENFSGRTPGTIQELFEKICGSNLAEWVERFYETRPTERGQALIDILTSDDGVYGVTNAKQILQEICAILEIPLVTATSTPKETITFPAGATLQQQWSLIAAAIKKSRQANMTTLPQLAKEIGDIKEESIRRIENGEFDDFSPHRLHDILERLCDHYQISFDPFQLLKPTAAYRENSLATKSELAKHRKAVIREALAACPISPQRIRERLGINLSTYDNLMGGIISPSHPAFRGLFALIKIDLAHIHDTTTPIPDLSASTDIVTAPILTTPTPSPLAQALLGAGLSTAPGTSTGVTLPAELETDTGITVIDPQPDRPRRLRIVDRPMPEVVVTRGFVPSVNPHRETPARSAIPTTLPRVPEITVTAMPPSHDEESEFAALTARNSVASAPTEVIGVGIVRRRRNPIETPPIELTKPPDKTEEAIPPPPSVRKAKVLPTLDALPLPKSVSSFRAVFADEIPLARELSELIRARVREARIASDWFMEYDIDYPGVLSSLLGAATVPDTPELRLVCNILRIYFPGDAGYTQAKEELAARARAAQDAAEADRTRKDAAEAEKLAAITRDPKQIYFVENSDRVSWLHAATLRRTPLGVTLSEAEGFSPRERHIFTRPPETARFVWAHPATLRLAGLTNVVTPTMIQLLLENVATHDPTETGFIASASDILGTHSEHIFFSAFPILDENFGTNLTAIIKKRQTVLAALLPKQRTKEEITIIGQKHDFPNSVALLSFLAEINPSPSHRDRKKRIMVDLIPTEIDEQRQKTVARENGFDSVEAMTTFLKKTGGDFEDIRRRAQSSQQIPEQLYYLFSLGDMVSTAYYLSLQPEYAGRQEMQQFMENTAGQRFVAGFILWMKETFDIIYETGSTVGDYKAHKRTGPRVLVTPDFNTKDLVEALALILRSTYERSYRNLISAAAGSLVSKKGSATDEDDDMEALATIKPRKITAQQSVSGLAIATTPQQRLWSHRMPTQYATQNRKPKDEIDTAGDALYDDMASQAVIESGLMLNPTKGIFH